MFEHNRCPLSYADRGANHKKAMLKNENNCVCVCMYLSSYISIHLYEMFTSGKFTETESMGWKQELMANRHEGTFSSDENVLKLDCCDSCTTL